MNTLFLWTSTDYFLSLSFSKKNWLPWKCYCTSFCVVHMLWCNIVLVNNSTKSMWPTLKCVVGVQCLFCSETSTAKWSSVNRILVSTISERCVLMFTRQCCKCWVVYFCSKSLHQTYKSVVLWNTFDNYKTLNAVGCHQIRLNGHYLRKKRATVRHFS